MANSGQKIATRYARALLQTLRSEGADLTVLRAAALDLTQFAEVWAENKGIRDFLLNPMFKRAERAEVLNRTLESLGVSNAVTRLLSLLFYRDRLNSETLPALAQAFNRILDRFSNTVRVEIETAVNLPDEEKRLVEDRLQGTIDGQAIFLWAINPALLGGLVVRFAGKILDGSVRTRLERVERALLAN